MQLRSAERLAIAFDIGTTTIAASLVGRGSGRRLAFAGRANPQRELGPDVISRMQAACGSEENFRDLCRSLNRALEEMAEALVADAGTSWDDVETVAMAGNPSMEHFALGLPVRSLAHLPFRPLFTDGRRAGTGSLGWQRDLDCFLFPLPGGFVGGDLVAFLFGVSRNGQARGDDLPALYLDLGTNGEMALDTGDAIWATSAAAGPAFEGGNLSQGMPALSGAIDRVRFDHDRVSVTTVNGSPPAGICGSGVLSAVAGMLDSGVLEPGGRIRSPREIESNLGNRVMESGGTTSFILSRNASGTVGLTQEDIRQVQLAKAAIRAGIEVMLRRAGMEDRALKKVIVTGSFGAVLAPEWLKSIGVFTENMVKIAGFVREGALGGIERALAEPRGFAAVEELARRIRVIPLSGTPSFEKHFLEQLDFPATKPGT